jgi:hypothetical protein
MAPVTGSAAHSAIGTNRLIVRQQKGGGYHAASFGHSGSPFQKLALRTGSGLDWSHRLLRLGEPFDAAPGWGCGGGAAAASRTEKDKRA